MKVLNAEEIVSVNGAGLFYDLGKWLGGSYGSDWSDGVWADRENIINSDSSGLM